MTSDPHPPGLGELGQRLQALSDPAAEPPRLRPYQSSPPVAVPPPPAPAPPEPPAYTAWQPFAAAPQESFYPAPPQDQLPQSAAPHHFPPLGATPSPAPAAPASPTPSSEAAEVDAALSSGLQRAINAVRNSIPLVQRLLPLFEGNIAMAATAITALVAPQPTVQHIHHPPAVPPPPPPAPVPAPIQVDLEPIERGLVEVRTAHRELRTQVAEQTTAIKRFEGQLEHVREATDRNTLEQQELVEDLRAVGSRVSTFALIGLVLLVLSLLVNTFLIVQMQRILH